MINRLLYGSVLGMALVTFSAGAHADAIHQTLSGDFLDDALGDIGGFLVGLLGFLV